MSETLSPQPSANDRLRRWIGPALLISLIINLFLVGMIATAMISHRGGPRGEFRSPPQPFFGMMRRGAADLPAGDRAAMRDIMMQQFPIIKPYFVKIDTARRNLADVIAATPYDPAKVAAAFARIDSAQAEMVKATREAMIQGFGKMSDEQRIRLADAMRKQADKRLKGPGRMDGRNLPPPPGEPGGMEFDAPAPSPDGPPPQ
ncbi:MAG: periplasmic heavy metal sensor [Parvibaculum sp.]|uniref:periplasmic heavy metal sensor n=1 Tax=Parvibaculum sp. TaxID=2024848 RepID=UPI0025F78A42|nr:periplasmic heavy metal sensor [Parvibaculum sp.]MCE9650532.1 periplasmic heavy metal sensor [Parvibaculum sp.]